MARRHPTATWRRAVKIGLHSCVGVVVAAGALTVWTVQRSAAQGAGRLEDGLALAGRGDTRAAESELRRALRSFRTGRAHLGRWWVGPARRIPLLDRQVSGAAAVFETGEDLSTTALAAAQRAGPERLRLDGGLLDLEGVRELGDALEDVAGSLERADRRLSDARRGLLVPFLDSALGEARARVRSALRDTRTAVLAARVVPALFGDAGPRRYFLAVQTPAESRGSGGIAGSFGELTFDRGRVRLERIGRSRDLNLGGDPDGRTLSGPPDYVARYGRFRPERSWQNITMSPDFPSVARVIEQLYPQSGGREVDGVISVDPIALAALLRLTGPVRVADWPEPLTAGNATDVLLRHQYTRFPGGERVDFLESTAKAVFDRLANATLPSPGAAMRALAPVVHSRHLQLHSTRPDEQRLFELIGADGAMTAVRGDFLSVVAQNAGGNKLDAFLHRSIRYHVTVDPDTGEVEADAVVRLENTAPTAGLPHAVIGNFGPRPANPGDNPLYLSIYSPLSLTGAAVDGHPLLMESERELERNVFSTFVTVPAGGAVTVSIRLAGSLPAGQTYRLDVSPQPTAAPDDLEVSVRAPDRRIVASRGFPRGQAAGTARLRLASRRTFEVDVE
jgi:hypothetical protein